MRSRVKKETESGPECCFWSLWSEGTLCPAPWTPGAAWPLCFCAWAFCPAFSAVPLQSLLFSAQVSPHSCRLLAATNSDRYTGRLPRTHCCFSLQIPFHKRRCVGQSMGAEKREGATLEGAQNADQRPLGPFLWVYFLYKKCACLMGAGERVRADFSLDFYFIF